MQAVLFMVKTMETVKRIRPKASWGFYMFPYKLHGPCHRSDGEVLCGSDDGEWGRKVSELYTADWLLPAWRAVDAIFPSIYLSKGVSADHQTAYVKVRLLRSTCAAHNLSAASVPSAICAPQSSVTSVCRVANQRRIAVRRMSTSRRRSPTPRRKATRSQRCSPSARFTVRDQ